MNNARRYLLNLWLAFASTVVVAVAVVSQLGTPAFAKRRLHGVARWWARGMLRITGATVSVKDVDNVPHSGPFVIMCNHRSHLDTPVLIEYVPFLFGFIVKEELMRIPIFSTAMKAMGCVAVSRSKASADRAVLDAVSASVQGGQNILIFPEGTRSPDDSFLPFKKGGVIMALKAGVPILPIALSGTGRVIPARVLKIRPGPVLIRFGKPIDTEHLTMEDRDQLLAEVRDAIEKLYVSGYPDSSVHPTNLS